MCKKYIKCFLLQTLQFYFTPIFVLSISNFRLTKFRQTEKEEAKKKKKKIGIRLYLFPTSVENKNP